MPKQINVDLSFRADTKEAQAQIAQLKKSLDDLMASSIKNSAFTGFNKDIANAQQSVMKLKSVIDNSLNMDTGRLDLSKFNVQLNNSGLSINKLASDMNAMGADGQKAFINLASSIVTAQKPMLETNKLLDGMWTALKNTARWQISSSILHGFMGAIQGAYGYAQDLNKSLTDIAIVTGRSTDQMAAFADQANKSAQALSVSTTAYTDAALIYYQQGLGDAEVKARTDITMMMSNVTGESAEKVSSYMTAIWNNFADGSDNLEHFADVITALGAATASSSEEIANGMQQFAAVADTVGLSYEYAATALATVVAQTRQSESTVGNSFRTIFSRLQGLKLGETLEDGTDLNKYSGALATIGVNIKDQNGELKEMDVILEEIGARWQSLSKDQQVALAQTVGGVRQYTNLIALFDNWDTFQKNLQVAYGSDGSLQKQADIYAESWEAAGKRMKAALQSIFQDVISDKFFITITDGLTGVIKLIDLLIDSLGGAPGILATIAALATNLLGDKMIANVQNMQVSLSKILKPKGSDQTYAEIEQNQITLNAINKAKEMRAQTLGSENAIQNDVVMQNLDKQLEMYGLLNNLRGKITDEEFKAYSQQIKTTEEYAKQVEELNQQIAPLREKANLEKAKARDHIAKMPEGKMKEKAEDLVANDFDGRFAEIASLPIQDQAGAIDIFIEKNTKLREAMGMTEQEFLKYVQAQVKLLGPVQQRTMADEAQAQAEQNAIIALERRNAVLEISKNLQKDNANLDELIAEQAKNVTTMTKEETKALLEKQKALLQAKNQERGRIGGLTKTKNSLQQDLDNEKAKLEQELTPNLQNAKTPEAQAAAQAAIEASEAKIAELSRQIAENQEKINNAKEKTKQIDGELAQEEQKHKEDLIKEEFEKSQNPPTPKDETTLPLWLQPDFAKNITAVTQGVSMLTASLTALGSIWDTLGDANLSGFEKFQRVVTSLITSVPMLLNALSTLGNDQAALAVKTLVSSINMKLFGKTTLAAGGEAATAGAITKAAWWEVFIIIGLIVAAIAALRFAWDAFMASTPEGKIKAAKDALEEQQEKANEAASAYEKLTSAINNYKATRDSLNDPTSEELTDLEKQEKVNAANQEIFDALKEVENWRDILGDEPLKYDENGLIELTNEQLNAIKNDQYRVQLLEKQKELQLEIAANATEQGNITFDNNTHMGAEVFWAKETGAMGSSYTQGATNDILNTLGDAGVTNLSSITTMEQMQEIFKNSNYSSEDLQNFLNTIQDISKNDETLLNEINEYLSGRYDRTTKAELAVQQEARMSMGSELNDYDAETQNMLVGKYAELDDMQKLDFTNLIAQGKSLTEAFAAFGVSVGDLTTKLNEFHDIAINVGKDDLTHFKGSEAELAEEIQNLTQYIQDNATSIDELDDHLKDCDEGARRVATAIIRFDDAIQDVTENYEDWNKALKGTDFQSKVKAVNDLRKAYGNLFDLDPGILKNLPKRFLESAENLDLMNDAINNVEGAYDQLAENMGREILTEIGIDTARWDYDKNWIEDSIRQLTGQDWDDIAIGASLDDAAFLQGLTDMVNAAGMSADQATAYLASMGVDAKVIEKDTEETETSTFTGATANVQDHYKMGYDPVARTEKLMNFPDVHYTPDPKTTTSKKQNKAFALEVVSAQKSSGGNFKFEKSKSGGGGGGKSGGSGCFAAGTLVAFNNYYENIENVKVGDMVLSYNEKTKKNEFSRVLQTMIHFLYEKIYTLFIENDELIVTGNHRFYITRNNRQEWIEAADLRAGDLVLFADGSLHTISKIKTKVRFLKVYNFEVSNTHNYYVGENKILAHNKGGGGGGGGKKEVKEKPKDEDRYHDLKERIADLNTELKRLDKNKDRAFGKSKLKYMDEEIKKTEKQIELTKEYISAIEDYLKTDRGALEGLDMGANFNTEGMLTNYEEVLKNINATYGAAIDAYNESAQSEADKTALENAKKAYEEGKKILSQYEKTWNLWQEQNEELLDQINDLYDKKLEKIKYQVELEIDFNEQDRKLLEWLFKRIGTDADFAADKIANLSKQFESFTDDFDIYAKGLKDIFAAHNIDLDFDNLDPNEIVAKLQEYMTANHLVSEITEEEAEMIRQYTEGMLDASDNMLENSNQVHETVINSMQEWLDNIGFITEGYNVLSNTLESYANIIDLTGRKILKMNSDQIRQLDQMRVKVSQDRLNSAKALLDQTQASAEEAKRNMDYFYSIGDTASGDAWKKIYEDFVEKWRDCLDDYQSAWEDAIQQNQDALERSLDMMVEDYKDSFGRLGLDWLAEEFERRSELDELYLPDYKKFHELNKSTSELGKSLAKTNNALVRGKMSDLLDDINEKMKDGVQVSEYETEIIARRVALLQAEAELENAKNAKNMVRMTRDNEGNFSYTYTSDSDAIDDAQQNYGDKFYELLDYERQTQQEIQSQMIQKRQEFIDKLRELSEQYQGDEEGFHEAAVQLAADYEEWLSFYTEQDQMLFDEMARLRDEDWKDVEYFTGLHLANTEDFITNWEDTVYGRLEPSYDSAQAALEAWLTAESIALATSNLAQSTWEFNLENIMNEAGTDMEDFRKKVDLELGLVDKKSEETKNKVKDMIDNPENGMKVKLKEGMDAAKAFDEAYSEKMKNIQTQSENARKALETVLQKLNETYEAQKRVADAAREAAQAIAEAAAAAAAAGNGGGGGGGGYDGGGSPYSGDNSLGKAATPSRYTYTVLDPRGSTIGSTTASSDSAGIAYFNSTVAAVGRYPGYYKLLRNGSFVYGKQVGSTSSSSGISSRAGFTTNASGGYTGDWGDNSGKLSILHRKEIVLNQEDTSNLLSSVRIVRGIADNLQSQIFKTGNIGINYSSLGGIGAGELEQQVHIEASFPNVQSHSEIELALNNLINSASQYVNRK